MSWTLVYANDERGIRTAGDEALLIEAVLNGKPVRILVDDGRDQPLVIDAQSLWVKYNNVYAQNTSSVSVKFEEPRIKFKEDSYWWMLILDTQGNREMIRWNVGEHVQPQPGRNEDRVAMKWFVG